TPNGDTRTGTPSQHHGPAGPGPLRPRSVGGAGIEAQPRRNGHTGRIHRPTRRSTYRPIDEPVECSRTVMSLGQPKVIGRAVRPPIDDPIGPSTSAGTGRSTRSIMRASVPAVVWLI